MHTRQFIELTQPEIAAQFKKNPLVIFPAGSVEQHGPHLPAGTDIFASEIWKTKVQLPGDGPTCGMWEMPRQVITISGWVTSRA